MLSYKKILFTGSSGRFGETFKNIHGVKNYIYPSSKEFNILKLNLIKNYLKKKKTRSSYSLCGSFKTNEDS